MQYWIWMIGGLGLIVLELFIPTSFYLVFLGSAAVVVGLGTAAGLVASWTTQVGLFCVVAIGLWFSLGRKLRGLPGAKGSQSGHLIGQLVDVSEDLLPGRVGAGSLWGSPWRVENVDSEQISAGSQAVVVRVEGITLKVTRRGA